MTINKDGYPSGLLIRAVWDCCYDLYQILGRAPSRQEFYNEIGKREPDRIGISTHSRQWGEWMRHHNFSANTTDDENIIPDEYCNPSYLIVWYAITQLKMASAVEIVKWILNSNSPILESEIHYHIDTLTVNSKARFRHLTSRKNLRTDIGSSHDLLFRSGKYNSTRYEEYIPELHGIWDIDPITKNAVQIIAARTVDKIVVEIRNEFFDNEPDTDDDIRTRALRQVVVREGQPKFRNKLLRAYEGKCAVTGCSIQELLEAAHIRPYAGPWHTKAQHGLLLKTDIHTLFDRGLIWVDSTFNIRVSERLANTEYTVLDGKLLRLPKNKEDWPLKTHLLEYQRYWDNKNNK
ncbi:HNH endonuclease [Providencia sp. PROV130]|nr:HNH endonuclease [Providencia sp. PROV130]